MELQPGQPNADLAAALNELGWSPKMLARRLNREFGTGTTAASAPYHWRDKGMVPRAPLPALTSHLLSQELGRVVSAAELWQGKAGDGAPLLAAGCGLDRPWTMPDLEEIVDDWVRGGLLDRRRFLAISGAGLTAIVANYLDGTAGLGTMVATSSTRLIDPLVDQVEQNLPLLQALDDMHGGGHHLSYVSAQFRAIGLLLSGGGHSAPSHKRLLQALAELGQLAGWMAFDAAEHGLAQRYFVTALRAAHQVDDRPLCAHILADLAFQAASREHATDAIPLGEAAQRSAQHAPAAVKASVLSRLAYAYASGGEEDSFRRTADEARETITLANSSDAPRWMYFLTENHLECQAGYAMIQLGRLTSSNGTTSSKRLLGDGASLLASGEHAAQLGGASDRRALFEGAWLALGHSTRGELEQACAIGELAASRLASVRSPRSVSVLKELSRDLRRRQRNPHVATFLPKLDSALSIST
ncbi:carph-isopro domain-containing protein [Nocardioides sp. NPDC101246]|uniref:carph-isopro domain-containing protein n=1 Tax=Nocardioides sp. NPDC101246 TaxID=3364336 RepID=UPI0038055DAB